MFRRLLLEDSITLYTVAAFVVVATIFVAFVWRAIRMSRRQCERFENLPFETPTPEAVALRVPALRSLESEGGSAGTDEDKSSSRRSRGGLHQSSDR